jgi:hypothetical protein
MSTRQSSVSTAALLLLTACLGGEPADAPYGRGGAVENGVVPNGHASSPLPFDAPAVQTNEHVSQAVIESVEAPDGTATVRFESSVGESVFEASSRLHEANGFFLEHGHAVRYGNRTVVAPIRLLS